MLLGPNGQPLLPPSAEKAAVEATGELFEKLNSLKHRLDAELSKAERYSDDRVEPQNGRQKGWNVDPFSLLDSVGMGFRNNPAPVTYETMRQMTERNTLLGSIINTRIHQVSSFCREQENQYSVGFKVRPRNKDARNRRLRPEEKERITRVERFLKHMGIEPNITRDKFVPFMKKVVRDRLTYDQVNFEKVWTRGGNLYEVIAHDPSTIRIAELRDPKGGPMPVRQHMRDLYYVQIQNGERIAEFTPRELAFCVANPRSAVKVNGYGFPEPQMLIMTVTAHLWAEEWNRKAFSQGSTIKGVLNLKGSISRQNYETFKRQWSAQVGGIMNAWRTPILNSDGVDFVPMQMSNTEMGYQMWIEYLIKMACAIYQMDPTEINFDLRGGTGAQPAFMSSNEAQQKMSKDRGLRPLLAFLQDVVNDHIVDAIDDQLEVIFVGLDAKTEEQSTDLRQKQGATMLTINELRALDDLPPLPKGGDIIANPVFTAYLQMQQGQQMQGGGGGMPGMPGGDPSQQQPGQDAQQPYTGRMGHAGDQPTDNAQQAAGKLQAFTKQQQGGDEDDDDDAGAGGVEPDTLKRLRDNDWTESVHASQRDSDLRKSIATLFIHELDV